MTIISLRCIAVFLIICSLSIERVNCLEFSPFCDICHEIVRSVQKGAPQKSVDMILQQIATVYCSRKHIQVEKVCHEAVVEMTPVIINSLWRHYTNPHRVCSEVKICSREYKIRNTSEEIKEILKDNPKKSWEKATRRKTLKVMHISDVHPDLYYTVGAEAKCSEPVCCRSNVTYGPGSFSEALSKYEAGNILKADNKNGSINKSISKAAGYWGSLSNCDLPFQTFDVFLKELQALSLDLIIWTGDNCPHDVWQQTQSYNLNYTVAISERLRRHTKTRIVPAMGNHESWPVNVYDFEGQRESVLNAGLANSWRHWLDEESYSMLRTKGYYSMTVPELNGVKVIALNTQAGNDMNWFLLRDPTDPGQMLKWVERELRAAEEAGQFVYLIGHISPRSSLNEWSLRFNALVERYSYTIRGQFYGHSHEDHMGFYPSFEDRQKLTGFFFLPSSLTTYSNKNPSYRIMDIDYDTLQVTDYREFMLDLRKYQSESQDAKFEHLYSFKDTYKVPDMNLQGGMSEVYRNMEHDQQTQKTYTYLMRGGLQKGKSGRGVFCATLSSPQFGAQCMGHNLTQSKFQKYAGPWKTLIGHENE